MIEVAIMIAIVAVAAFLMLRKDDAQDAPLVMTVHGNSALAGGWFDGPTLRFYAPTPVQMLQAKLPGIRIVDCAQNGLKFGEALDGGPVERGQPVLGQTSATCTSLRDLWMTHRPQVAYIALAEVDALVRPDWKPEDLADEIAEAVQTARELGVLPILQGCIWFADGGPVDAAALARVDEANRVALEHGRALGVPVVDIRTTPFDPARDVCPDGLHPTGYMHERYTQTRANAIAAILTTEAKP